MVKNDLKDDATTFYCKGEEFNEGVARFLDPNQPEIITIIFQPRTRIHYNHESIIMAPVVFFPSSLSVIMHMMSIKHALVVCGLSRIIFCYETA